MELPILTLLSFSLLLSLFTVYTLINKLRKIGLIVKDYYKPDLRLIPTGGGISILIVLFILYSYTVLINNAGIKLPIPTVSQLDSKALIVIGFFGLYGLLDDHTDVGRATKIFLTYSFSLPLAVELRTEIIVIPLLGFLNIGLLYMLVIVPVYIMVTSNLVNMHSGFNGMAVGLSTIIIGFLLLKSIITGRDTIFMLTSMLGALLGLLWFNRYPSRVFEGNIGSLSMGAAIGSGIVANGFLVSGFIMLIPHTINFLMYIYWRVMRKLQGEYRWELKKFGRVREDWTIEVPNPLTLKWVLPYYFRMTEKQIVLAMYSITSIFCVFGLFIDF